MYATYEYYLGTYGGKHATSTSFTGLEVRACAYANYYTKNRIIEVTDSVKLAVCEIVDALEKLDQSDGKTITSESVGSSVSMSYDITDTDPAGKKAKSILLRYLGHSGLMYRGV